MADQGVSLSLASVTSPLQACELPTNTSNTPKTTPPGASSSINDAHIDGMADNEKTEKDNDNVGKTKSSVCIHYTRETIDGVKKARCIHCNRPMMGDPKHGTTHLKNHLDRCAKRKTNDIRQQVLQGNFNKGKFGVSSYNFDQQVSRNGLAKAIILHEYPLSIVEHNGFRNFCNSLNPCFTVVSRNTIKRDCYKIYDVERAAVMQILEKCKSRVAVTTDMWTSSTQKKGFMAVTAHFIDNGWTLQSRLISFIFVPSPHTSEVLCEALLDCLLDWNIGTLIANCLL